MAAPKVIRRVTYTNISQDAIDQVVSENGIGYNWSDIQQHVDAMELAGESLGYSSYSASGQLQPFNETHWRGGSISGSFEYVGGYRAGQSPSHGTVDIIHAPYWKGQISGAIEATITTGTNLYFSGLKSGSSMYFLNSGSGGVTVPKSGTSTTTSGLVGQVVYTGGGLSSSKYISGLYHHGASQAGYITSSNFSSDDLAAFSGSNFTGSVVVGNAGKLDGCNFTTEAQALASNPGNYLSASIEIAWNLGEISGSNGVDPQHRHRAAVVGGDFTMSGSVFTDPVALLFRITGGDMFTIKTEASGAIVTDNEVVSRGGKRKADGTLFTGNYYTKRNASGTFSKTVVGTTSKKAVDDAKTDAISNVQSIATGSAATVNAGVMTSEQKRNLGF
tara:strand:+ start:443 stop:1609 length:1167 start_codon:yes stop_codon:yes gene_type:complete